MKVFSGLGVKLIGSAEQSRRGWPEVIAEVTECHYDVQAGRSLAFGLASNKHFRIAYNYRVGGDLHEGECFSKIARPQGSLFPVRYDPALPHLSHLKESVPRFPILGFVAGVSVALSLLVLLCLHGC